MNELELRKRAREVRARLVAVQKDVAALGDAMDSLEVGIGEMESKRQRTVESAVADVEELRSEQRQHIDDARQRGQGAGLYRALDVASKLDAQQSELLQQARRQPELASAKEVLRRYEELERQQVAILTDEIGKFEAQGMRSLFDRYRELADEQHVILTEVLGAHDG